MKLSRLVCASLMALLVLPLAARADVLLPGQKPPRNQQSEAFISLNADMLVPWDSAYDHAFDSVEEVVYWSYPGASAPSLNTVKSEYFTDELSGWFTNCYVDSEGRFWGYNHYNHGRRMAWICLSDPGNADLSADPELIAAVDKEVVAMTLREQTPAIIMVAGVVVVTGALIYIFWYRKKKRA